MLATVRAPLVVSNTDGIGQTYVVANQSIGAMGINERFGITISAGDNAPEKIKIFAPGDGTFDQGDVLGNVTSIMTYFGNTGGTRLRIDGDRLVVVSGATIDYEAERQIALSVTATDRAGLSVTTSLTIAATHSVQTFNGTAGNDTLFGGAGADTVHSLLGDLLGDTITDVDSEDRIVVERSDLVRADVRVTGTGASTALVFGTGQVAL